MTDGARATLPGHRFTAVFFAVATVVALLVMGLMAHEARLDDRAHGTMLAVYSPSADGDAVFQAISRAGVRPVRATWLDFVWVVHGDAPGAAGALMQQGALGAYRQLPFSPQLGGCIVFADAKVRQMFAIRP